MNRKISVAPIVLCAVSLTMHVLSNALFGLFNISIPMTLILLYMILRKAKVNCRIVQPVVFTVWLLYAIIAMFRNSGIFVAIYLLFAFPPVIWFTVAAYTGVNIKGLHIVAPLVMIFYDLVSWIVVMAMYGAFISITFFLDMTVSVLFYLSIMLFALKVGFIKPFGRQNETVVREETRDTEMKPLVAPAVVNEQPSVSVQVDATKETKCETEADASVVTEPVPAVVGEAGSDPNENNEAETIEESDTNHDAPVLDYQEKGKNETGALGTIGYQSRLKPDENTERPVMEFGDPGDMLNDPVHDRSRIQTYQQYVEEANVPVLDQVKKNNENPEA